MSSRPPSAHIFDDEVAGIDPELRAQRVWICWHWRWLEAEQKWDKPPVDAVAGFLIDATNPALWLEFEQARAMARQYGHDGIGFALGSKLRRLGYVGVDVDKCIGDDGEISPEAMWIVEALESYTEITPSGKGLRVLIKGAKPGTRCKHTKKKIEIYQQDRFFTVTGKHLYGTPTTINERSEELAALYRWLFDKDQPTSQQETESEPLPSGDALPDATLDEVDEALLAKAYAAENGAKFKSLFNDAGTSGYNSDPSSADMALMCGLAFWTANDTPRMLKLFTASTRGKRKKWQTRADYRRRTIKAAIDFCQKTYSPARGGTEHSPHDQAASANGQPQAEAKVEPQSRRPEQRPEASANGQPKAEAKVEPETKDDRPQIEVNFERHEVVHQTVAALTRDQALYHRGSSLGVVIREKTDIADLGYGVEFKNAAGSLRFLKLSDSMVGCHLTENAVFYQWKKGSNEEFVPARCHPPDWLINAVESKGYWPGIRQLFTIATCPYVRPDATLCPPGFDPATGCLYQPSVELGSLPDRPTKDDATEAVSQLHDIVHQFPFGTDADFSVWLAALLTAVQRPAIAGPTPGFALNANQAGCGKGLLVDVVGIIALGHRIPTRSYPDEVVEAAKVKLSIGLAALAAVHFDNLERGDLYGNKELDSALTSTVTTGRLLGLSREAGPVPLRPVWFLSGNNISPAKDAYRQWLPCNLVTELEAPYERRDIEVSDLRRHVQTHRAELLRHALTILLAHAQAGYPAGDWAPLGSFEVWDPIIRGAVWFATDTDCLTTQRQAAADAPERLDDLAFLEGWKELAGGANPGLTAEEALKDVQDNPDSYPTLCTVLKKMTKNGGFPTPKHLGYRLRSLQRKPVEGLRLMRGGEKNHCTLVDGYSMLTGDKRDIAGDTFFYLPSLSALKTSTKMQQRDIRDIEWPTFAYAGARMTHDVTRHAAAIARVGVQNTSYLPHLRLECLFSRLKPTGDKIGPSPVIHTWV
jgi:primase-polymerase (primpol)-like protein